MSLDCLVIGHNDTPFEAYEQRLRRYGEDSEAYRDLKLSFVDLGERKVNYMALLDHVLSVASECGAGRLTAFDVPVMTRMVMSMNRPAVSVSPFL